MITNDCSDYNDVQSTSNHEDRSTQNRSSPVQTSQQCIIPPFSEFPLFFTTPFLVIVALLPHWNIARTGTGIIVHRGMVIVQNNTFSFGVLTENVFARPIHIPKQLYVITASLQLGHIMYYHFSRTPRKSPKKEVQGGNKA